MALLSLPTSSYLKKKNPCILFCRISPFSIVYTTGWTLATPKASAHLAISAPGLTLSKPPLGSAQGRGSISDPHDTNYATLSQGKRRIEFKDDAGLIFSPSCQRTFVTEAQWLDLRI